MNKKFSTIFVVLFFTVLASFGTASVVEGAFPFSDNLRHISSGVKSMLYLPAKEDHAIAYGTFDINLPVPETTSLSAQNDEVEIQSVPAASTDKQVDLDLTNSTGYLIVGDTLMQMCNIYDENLQIYADNINRLTLNLPDKNIISMVVPNSFPFYAPPQYITAGVNQEAMINNLYAKLEPDVITIDVFSEIKNNLNDYNYFRTDHHWTARGAYHGYTAFCRAMGFTAKPLPGEPSGTFENYIGTLYKTLEQYPQAQAALKNPDYIEYYQPSVTYTASYYNDASMKNGKSMKVIQPDLSAVDDKYLVFLEGLRPVIHINTEVKNDRGILIIKDSYANAFVPFILPHYEDIYVVDFRNFNAPNLPIFNAVDFVNSHGIDDIMIENYPYVPNDKAHSELIGKMIP